MSEFSNVLTEIFDSTLLFSRKEWDKLLAAKSSDWVADIAIPTPFRLNMLYLTVERADGCIELADKFKVMAHKRATLVSPLGDLMLPTVWEYMKRPTFSDLSSKLAKLKLPQQMEFLRELYPEE